MFWDRTVVPSVTKAALLNDVDEHFVCHEPRWHSNIRENTNTETILQATLGTGVNSTEMSSKGLSRLLTFYLKSAYLMLSPKTGEFSSDFLSCRTKAKPSFYAGSGAAEHKVCSHAGGAH